MFLENNINGHQHYGWIEVIAGSMFSGKTEELLRRLKRAKISKLKVEIFKPKTDSRYSVDEVVSHDENAIPSIPVEKAADIIELANDFNVIGIDEAQFFDDNIVNVCNELAENGKRVIVAGLDMDFRGQPFGPMPALLSIAEYITKVHAICMRCGNLAQFSHRLNNEGKQIMLGEKDTYEPLCRTCYVKLKNAELTKG